MEIGVPVEIGKLINGTEKNLKASSKFGSSAKPIQRSPSFHFETSVH